MRHWSQLADTNLMSLENYDAIDAENREVFQELQSHPQWGRFFRTFGYRLRVQGRGSAGELVVGEKFAEGGQAELFHAHVTWWNPESNEEDQEQGFEWVLKVFKKGTVLRHLQSQWLEGYLKLWAKMPEYGDPDFHFSIIHHCEINSGILLEDGRFSFLLRRQHEDLRSFIDRKMLNIGQDCGPFSKDFAESLIYCIGLGMEFLHGQNIVHRDLKASNVLYSEYEETCEESWGCYVADFECSARVVGTGFFKAPEILQACKRRI
jgi:serine/threonine protein kinase